MRTCKEVVESAINRAMDPDWFAPMAEAELIVAARQADALEAIDRTQAALLAAQVMTNERLHALSDIAGRMAQAMESIEMTLRSHGRL